MYLADVVPTVDVNGAFLTPPPVTSVTDLALDQPRTFTVKLPSFDKPTLSTGELAAIAGAVLLFLFSESKRGRR